MKDIFEEARIQDVESPKGRFSDGSPRRVKAPFVFISLPAIAGANKARTNYIMPRSTPDSGLPSNASLAVGSDAFNLHHTHTEFGYLNGKPALVIEEYEMGFDPNREEHDLLNMHQFGYI